ncbi:MAG: hypothetical protein B7Z73_14695 [Planctomycetia bacterium 21-64-5]|nr:MAG: hypothetical protein B7Z73_14695 [Planctomycetia bacterium 21-64-5]HQU42119.1 hypothetical protein [Pirellulales bacterium]
MGTHSIRKSVGRALAVISWLSCFATAPLFAADIRLPANAGETADADQIAKLVGELGANTFIVRQHAQRALVEIGLPAKAALETAVHDPDGEVRQRARQALAAIADVDFHARLGAFLADPDPDHDYGLAGWQRYRSLSGEGPAARRLFADMQRAERELLEAVANAPAQAGALLDARCQQVENGTAGDPFKQSHLSLATMSALLFASGNPEVPVSAHAGGSLFSFGSQAALAQAMHSRPPSPVRPLVAAWVGRSFEVDSLTSYRNQLLAMQYNLKEAVAPALKLIQPPGGRPEWEHFAILAIAKLGGQEHVAALEPLLNDERTIDASDRGGQKSDAEIRDVALAAMLHLTGQKLSDYGFQHAKANPTLLWNATSLGFNDPAAREEALKKWRAWAEKHLK